MDGNPQTGKGGETRILVLPETAVSRFRKPLVEYLISGLEEEDKWVRILAADMLGCVGDKRAVERLKPLMADRDRDLRAISANAIDGIVSRQSAPVSPGPDPCASCMIRHIAEEALRMQKDRAEQCTSPG